MTVLVTRDESIQSLVAIVAAYAKRSNVILSEVKELCPLYVTTQEASSLRSE